VAREGRGRPAPEVAGVTPTEERFKHVWLVAEDISQATLENQVEETVRRIGAALRDETLEK